MVVTAMRWFTFTSSHPEVASVDSLGVILAKAVGTTTVTAKLGTVDAAGALSVTVGQSNVPTAGAPEPTEADADVLSLYSNAYTNLPHDARHRLEQRQRRPAPHHGHARRRRCPQVHGPLVGIEVVEADLIDASAMTHFHVDVWTHDATLFKVKLA